MSDTQRLEQALVAAHAADDTEAAKRLAQAIREAKAPEERGFFGGIADAVRGDAAENLPNVNQAGMTGLREGVASMLGGDDDYANALAKSGYQIEQDANGNPVAVDPQTGERAYINQPGLDAEDVTRFAGKAASFFPAARAVGAIGSLGRRALAMAVGAGATDAALQTGGSAAGGDVDVDASQVMLAAAAGGAGELGGAVLSRLHTAWKARGAVGDVVRAAREAGLDLSDDQARELAKQFAQRGGSLDDAVAAERFGIRRTAGQQSGSHSQLSREEVLRQSPGGQPLRDLESANREAIEAELRRYLGQDTQAGAAARAGESLRSQYDDLAGQVSRAYDEVGALKVAAGSADELPQRFRGALRDADVLVGDDLNATQRALALVDDNLAKMQESGTTAFSLKAIDQTRRQLNSLHGRAANPSDHRALTVLRREYDAWVDDAVDNALYSGDEAALSQLQQARSLRAELGRKFQDPKEIAKIVTEYENLAPEEIANHLLGAARFGKAGAARIVKQYKAAGGDVEPLREIMMQRLVTRQGGETIVGNQAIVSNIREAAKGKGESLMRELFTPDELNRLALFTNVIDDILPKGDFARSSGTAERALRYANELVGSLPVMRDLLKGLQTAGQYMGAQSAVSGGLPAVAPRGVPALAGATQTTRP